MTLRRTRKMFIHRLFGVPNEKSYKSSYRHINVRAKVLSQRLIYVGVSECVRKVFYFFYYVGYTAHFSYRNLRSGRSVFKIRAFIWTNTATVQTQIIFIVFHCFAVHFTSICVMVQLMHLYVIKH
jgi:hypothetical protein